MQIQNFNQCSPKKGFHNFYKQLFPFIIWEEFSENALKEKHYNEEFLTDVLNSKKISTTVSLFQNYKNRKSVPASFRECFSRIIPDNIAFNLNDYDEQLCQSYAGLMTYYLYMIEKKDFYNPVKDCFLEIQKLEELFWKDFINYIPLTGKNEELIYYDANHNIFRCDFLGNRNENKDSEDPDSDNSGPISPDDKFYYHHPKSILNAFKAFLHEKYLCTSFYLEKKSKIISLLNAYKEGLKFFYNMPSPEVLYNKNKADKKDKTYVLTTISSLEDKYEIKDYYDIDDENKKIALKTGLEEDSDKFSLDEETNILQWHTIWEKYAIKNIENYKPGDMEVQIKAQNRFNTTKLCEKDAEKYITVLQTTIKYCLEACKYDTCNQYSSLYETIKNISIEWNDKRRLIEHKLGLQPFSYDECDYIDKIHNNLVGEENMNSSVFDKLEYIRRNVKLLPLDDFERINILLQKSQNGATEKIEDDCISDSKDWTGKYASGELKSGFAQRIYNVILEEFRQESEFTDVLPEFIDVRIKDQAFLKEILAYMNMGLKQTYSAKICKSSQLFLQYAKYFKNITIHDKKIFARRMADALCKI